MNYRSNVHIDLTSDTRIVREIRYEEILEQDIAYKLYRTTPEAGFVKVHLTDGYVVLWLHDAIFHCIVWRTLIAFSIPILVEDIHKRIAFSTTNLAKLCDRYVRIIKDRKGNVPRGELNEVLFNFINYLYNFTCSELSGYAETISILGLVKIMNHPKIKPIINIKYRKNLGIDVLEQKLTDATADLIDVLTDPNEMHPDHNQLFYYLKTKQINVNQLSQMMIMHGPRTDVDDTIILHPVTGSTIGGLKCIEDVVVDSLSAKKTAFYMQVSVSESQYMGRKQHILSSSIMRIYKGDCGTDVLLPVRVKENNYTSLVGAYTPDENTGMLTPITSELAASMIGQTIKVRNPITCKCKTDGFCQTCGGELMFNIAEHTNMGILSAIQFIDPTTQKILSAKHLVKTVSLLHEFNEETSKYFTRLNSNEVTWCPKMIPKLKNYRMGIFIKELGSLHDIAMFEADEVSTLESYSNISRILLEDIRTKEIIELDMTYCGASPVLSIPMLVYIRNLLRQGDPESHILWIPLEKTAKMSIFSTSVINDSMMKFIKSVNTFISKSVKTYKDASLALEGFSDTIFSKVSYIHITHLSAILKLYLITNQYDYRIPNVNNPAKVMFSTLSDIVSRRSLGGQFAFEKHKEFIYNPISYLVPRGGSVFDRFIGITTDKSPIRKSIASGPSDYLVY